MIKVIFDTNIYDILEKNSKMRSSISSLIDQSLLTVFMPRAISEELSRSPLRDIYHSFFPINHVGNTVGDVNMTVCDSIGSGNTFRKHVGKSNKLNDAYIVDASEYYADWLVSEDKRLKNRAKTLSDSVVFMDYQHFSEEITKLIQVSY